VFKISQARQVPLLAGLASKFASARARAATLCFGAAPASRKSYYNSPRNSFQVRIASRKSPQANRECRMGEEGGAGRDLTACAGVSERAQRASIPLAPRDIMRTV